VLRAINAPPGAAGGRPDLGLRRVLDALVASVGRLCGAETAGIQQLAGDGFRVLARYARDPEADARRFERLARAGRRRGVPTRSRAGRSPAAP
jgi:hypothetical protein